MAAIVLAALQVFFLLLKAYLDGNSDKEKAIAKVKEAQLHLDQFAQAFETKLRFSGPKSEQINHLQDVMDQEEKLHGRKDNSTSSYDGANLPKL